MNLLTIAGRIGKDAELRHTSDGIGVCSFNVAVDTRAKGEKATLWVRCSMWGERGEKLSPYLTKGTAVSVAGEARATAYTSKQSGELIAQLELRVDRVTLLGGGREAQPKNDEPDKSADPAHDDDEIPF